MPDSTRRDIKSHSRERVTNGDLSDRLTAIERRLEVVERERAWFRETFDRISESTHAIREKVEVLSQRQYKTDQTLDEISGAVKSLKSDMRER